MSAQQVQQVVHGYLDALRSRADYGRFLSGDVTFEVAGADGVARGADVVERGVRHHYEVEFDARPEIVRLINDDRVAAAELVFVGTHVGEYEGLQPTGKAVRLPLAMFFEVENDAITAIRVYYSREQIMEQLRH